MPSTRRVEKHHCYRPGETDSQTFIPASGAGNCSGLQNRSALPDCSYLLTCAGFPSGALAMRSSSIKTHQPGLYLCQICNHHAKIYPASTPHPWRSCLRIHYGEKHLRKILFFLLLVVLNVKIFPPHEGQKVTKYITASGKWGGGGESVLAIFPLSFP